MAWASSMAMAPPLHDDNVLENNIMNQVFLWPVVWCDCVKRVGGCFRRSWSYEATPGKPRGSKGANSIHLRRAVARNIPIAAFFFGLFCVFTKGNKLQMQLLCYVCRVTG